MLEIPKVQENYLPAKVLVSMDLPSAFSYLLLRGNVKLWTPLELSLKHIILVCIEIPKNLCIINCYSMHNWHHVQWNMRYIEIQVNMNINHVSVKVFLSS